MAISTDTKKGKTDTISKNEPAYKFNGMTWYDMSDDTLKVWDNGVWIDEDHLSGFIYNTKSGIHYRFNYGVTKIGDGYPWMILYKPEYYEPTSTITYTLTGDDEYVEDVVTDSYANYNLFPDIVGVGNYIESISVQTNGTFNLGGTIGYNNYGDDDLRPEAFAYLYGLFSLYPIDLTASYNGRVNIYNITNTKRGNGTVVDYLIETYDDGDNNKLNRFQAVLWDNGDIQYNYKEFNCVSCGDVYLSGGAGDTYNQVGVFGTVNYNDEVILISISNQYKKMPFEFETPVSFLLTKEVQDILVNDFNILANNFIPVFDWIEQSNPKNISLLGVTYGNGLFVAVGLYDTTDAYIVTSTDGVNWTEQSNPKSVSLHGITYGNGLFVAVGWADGTDAYIITSPDGINWTEQSNPKNINLFGVTYGNGLFVAVGVVDRTDAYLITSTDGVNWTEQSNPKNYDLRDVAYGNGMFVAVGYRDLNNFTDAYLITSTDGIAWTEQSNPKNFNLYGITYGNGMFVAVGDADGTDAYIITSTDGVTWTEQSNPKNINLFGVTYGNGLFVAVGVVDGTDASIITSTDGVNWTEQSNPKNFNLYEITYGNGLFVAVGYHDGTDAYILTK